MKSEEQRRAAIRAELDELILHRSGSALRQLVALLDALAEDTLADLARIAPEHLSHKQGALAQIQALRRAIVDPGPHSSPKV